MSPTLCPSGSQASDPSSSPGPHLSSGLGGGHVPTFQGLLRPLLPEAHGPFLLVSSHFLPVWDVVLYRLKSCQTKDEHSLHERDLFLLAQALSPYPSPFGCWCGRQVYGQHGKTLHSGKAMITAQKPKKRVGCSMCML